MAKFWKDGTSGEFLLLPGFSVFMTDPTNCCCPDPCVVCDSGTTPIEVELTVPTGTLSGTYSGTPCSDYEGTFTLTQLSINPCVWNYTFGDGAVWILSLPGTVRVAFGEPPGGRIPAVVFRTAYPSSPPDCGFSALSLPWDTNEFGASCTSGSGKSVSITSL